ncbi:MAG: hypothetical protein IT225_03770 [Flavobacteriales bacterium]|jgi:hypothetical protein|nr:hypothetical protein [Flavobacteriales bacterium]
MKGVSILYDEVNDRRLLQVDLSEVVKDEEGLEDLFDIIIAESRKDDEKISLEELTALLKKEGKL